MKKLDLASIDAEIIAQQSIQIELLNQIISTKDDLIELLEKELRENFQCKIHSLPASRLRKRP